MRVSRHSAIESGVGGSSSSRPGSWRAPSAVSTGAPPRSSTQYAPASRRALTASASSRPTNSSPAPSSTPQPGGTASVRIASWKQGRRAGSPW